MYTIQAVKSYHYQPPLIAARTLSVVMGRDQQFVMKCLESKLTSADVVSVEDSNK